MENPRHLVVGRARVRKLLPGSSESFLEGMSKRRRFAHLLHWSGALKAILALRARASPPWLSVLTYHRFESPNGDEPFDDGVVDATIEDFDRQVACLKSHFTVVGIDELCAYATGTPLPPNPVAITFDDGYLDGYEYALPILARHGCKAIFFVPTRFITERRMYWWDRAAYFLKATTESKIHLEYPNPMDIDLSGDKLREIHRVFRVVKHQSLDLERFLDELAVAARVPWSRDMERQFADRLLMRWDHVRALRNAGMDVQSHTRTHRVLQTLPESELLDELRGSRIELEREIGGPVRSVAYPVGNPLGGSSPIRAALTAAGYELGFTNGTGPTPLWGELDPFNIRRQTVERGLPEAYLLSILAVPPLAPKHPWHLRAK
jgi:peptidoglycan/xylan/chitin deacetylase (PgdA/CDA1 family)